MHLKKQNINKKLGEIFSQTNNIDDCFKGGVEDKTSDIIYLPLNELNFLNIDIIETIKDEYLK